MRNRQSGREGVKPIHERKFDDRITIGGVPAKSEVFVDCPVEVCEGRDPKGMYKKARDGLIKEFTGVSAPYEVPEDPEIHLRTDEMSVEQCVQRILEYLVRNGLVRG